MKTATINTRIDENLKNDVENIFSELGITTTQAVNMFFSACKNYNGIPFELRILNKETREAITDLEKNKDVAKAQTTSELFDDLGI